jgi:hypothetical protein
VLPVVDALPERDPPPVRSRWLIPIALALLCLPAAAGAQESTRQTAELTLDSQRPGTSTGARLSIDYVNPADPEAKPPAVQKVVLELPAGARIDTSAPAVCGASNAQLIAGGPAACPPESRVGGGELLLDTGVPGPARLLDNHVTLLNNTGELIFVLESKSEPGARIVTRAVLTDTTITTEVNPIPGGPPDGFVAIKRVRLALDERPGYVTTPPSCPPARVWTSTATFAYRDGASQAVKATTPCVAPVEDCRRGPRMSFKLHRRDGTRVVRVAAYVNGRRALHRSGHDLGRITLGGLPTGGRISIRIVATHSTGSRVVSTRSWNGCSKSGPRVRVVRG